MSIFCIVIENTYKFDEGMFPDVNRQLSTCKPCWLLSFIIEDARLPVHEIRLLRLDRQRSRLRLIALGTFILTSLS